MSDARVKELTDYVNKLPGCTPCLRHLWSIVIANAGRVRIHSLDVRVSTIFHVRYGVLETFDGLEANFLVTAFPAHSSIRKAC